MLHFKHVGYVLQRALVSIIVLLPPDLAVKWVYVLLAYEYY